MLSAGALANGPAVKGEAEEPGKRAGAEVPGKRAGGGLFGLGLALGKREVLGGSDITLPGPGVAVFG